MTARLEITDGTTTIHLIQTGGNVWYLNEWIPRIAGPKAGGVYQESALSDGRRLVDRRFDTIAETFDMKGSAGDPDAMALALQRLRALLEKAVQYWTTDWQSTPVYFVCQSDCETNERYALIVNYSTPNDENPFSQPWQQLGGRTMVNDWTLTIERDHWTENPPGTGTAVEISAVEAYNAHNYGNVDSSEAREPTTANEVYIANKRNEANITHIYVDNGGAWTGNLLGSGVPYDLLPAVPALNDAVYFGISTALADSGPFSSLVFDIGTAQSDCELLWEYFDGAIWTTLLVQDNTDADGAETGEPFDTTGVNSVHWRHPSDWATRDISNDGGPAVTGYFVRARIDAAVGAAPSPPTQQNRDVYSIVWPYVEIQATTIGGSLPALAQIKTTIESDDGIISPALFSNRVIMGLRSMSRGTNFTAYLNLAQEQNPTGITAGAGGTGSLVADVTTPTGWKLVNTNPDASISLVGGIIIDSSIAEEYEGQYRVFVRGKQTSGSAGDLFTQVRVGHAQTGEYAYHISDAVPFESTNNFQLLDFGQVEIVSQFAGLPVQYVRILIWASGDGAADAEYYDVILMPIDEFAIECLDVINSSDTRIGGGEAGELGRYLLMDSITNYKDTDTPVVRKDDDLVVTEYMRIANNSHVVLQANSRQRLWFLSSRFPTAGNDNQRSEPEVSFSVQVQCNQRYFSYRGDQ